MSIIIITVVPHNVLNIKTMTKDSKLQYSGAKCQCDSCNLMQCKHKLNLQAASDVRSPGKTWYYHHILPTRAVPSIPSPRRLRVHWHLFVCRNMHTKHFGRVWYREEFLFTFLYIFTDFSGNHSWILKKNRLWRLIFMSMYILVQLHWS